MSVLGDLASEYERKVSSSNAPPSPRPSESRKNEIVIRIDGSLQHACTIPLVCPGEEEETQRVANDEADLTSHTIVIQIDNKIVVPARGPPQANATKNSADSSGAPPAPLPPPNADHQVQAQIQQLNRGNLTESSLFMIAAQASVTLLAAWLGNNSNSLSRSTKILRDFAVGSNIIGCTCSFNNILMCRHRNSLAARILYTFAFAGAAFGFIASMGMLLPEELKLWVTLLACTLCFPGLAGGLRGG